jgi:hypothetical protein
VRSVFSELLDETGRAAFDVAPEDLVPGFPPPEGWGEASGASWAGFLKRIESKIKASNTTYYCYITATDGHVTWKQPLRLSIYLVTAKIIAAEHARHRVSRRNRC